MLYNQVTKGYRHLDNSRTRAGLFGYHALLPSANFLLAIAENAIWYQHVNDIGKLDNPASDSK